MVMFVMINGNWASGFPSHSPEVRHEFLRQGMFLVLSVESIEPAQTDLHAFRVIFAHCKARTHIMLSLQHLEHLLEYIVPATRHSSVE